MTEHSPRLLVAVSGSEASRKAAAVAADLAGRFSAELTILHVTAPLECRLARRAPEMPITGAWMTR